MTVYKMTFIIKNNLEKLELNSNQQLSHKCNNKECCNPDHIELTSQSNNIQNSNKEIFINKKVYKGEEKKKRTRPSNLTEIDSLEWYKNNAIIIDNNNCWIWQRETGEDGYGRLKWKQKKYMVHSWFYCVHNKCLEINLLKHICNIKNCCNPDHLQPGNRSENALDWLKIKRNTISDAQLLELLKKYKEFQKNSNKKISEWVKKRAQELSLSSETVKHYIYGQSRRHIFLQIFPKIKK